MTEEELRKIIEKEGLHYDGCYLVTGEQGKYVRIYSGPLPVGHKGLGYRLAEKIAEKYGVNIGRCCFDKISEDEPYPSKEEYDCAFESLVKDGYEESEIGLSIEKLKKAEIELEEIFDSFVETLLSE